MEFLTAEAMVLDVVDLHEFDRIVTFLTRERGKKRGVARGARRKYSRFSGQLQQLAKVRVTWLEKAERELVRISSLEMLRPASGLQADLEGILLGSYLADHMLEFAQENETHDGLYRLLDSTVESLLAGAHRSVAARYFEAWVLRLAGVFPAPRECPLCGRDLAAAGAVLAASGEALVCERCGGSEAGARRLTDGALEFLSRIGGESPRQAARRPPPSEVLDEVERICARVRRSFLQHELKSYRVIRETLAGPGD